MFHDIPAPIRRRMADLEAMDRIDRGDGTPRLQRLRQVEPVTARLLALLAAAAPAGAVVEIGTSAGYSTLWLGLSGRPVTTFEWDPRKAHMARDTFRTTGVEDRVTLIEGDARQHLDGFDAIAFCFLDAEKELYADCYHLVVPRLVSGGMLAADNTINHRATLQPMIDTALADERLDVVDVPIGMGLLVARRV